MIDIHKTTQERIDFLVKILYAAVVLLLCCIGLRIAGLVWPFLLALVLVGCINPLVRFIHQKLRINQKLASVALLAALYTGIGFALFSICARVIFLLQDIFRQMPEYYDATLRPALEHAAQQVEGWLSNLPDGYLENLNAVAESLSSSLTGLIESVSDWGIGLAADLIGGIPNLLISIVFAILLSFFTSLQYDEIKAFLKVQLPDKVSDTINNLKVLCRDTVLKYLKALFILMLCTFAELSVGFFLLDVANPLGKAAVIAIFDALPIFGTGGIMIPWILLELLQGNLPLSFGLAVLYAIVTVIRNLLEPKVVGDQLGLNPVVSLISIYLGYRLLGVAGMILFPILAQILLTLHQNGTIRLYREQKDSQTKNDAP